MSGLNRPIFAGGSASVAVSSMSKPARRQKAGHLPADVVDRVDRLEVVGSRDGASERDSPTSDTVELGGRCWSAELGLGGSERSARCRRRRCSSTSA